MVRKREISRRLLCGAGLTAAIASACNSTGESIGDRPDPGVYAGTGGQGSGARAGAGGSTGAPSNTGGAAGLPPTPAAVGFSLSLSAPTASAGAAVGSRQCLAGTTGAFTYVIGAPEPGHTIEDGKAGVMVTCFVDASIDGTSEDISLMASGIDQNGAKPVSVSLSAAVPLDGNGAAVSEPAPATLTFFSPDTGHLSTLEPFPSCTLGPATVLKRGAMLADVDCALIGSVDDVTNGCRVHGTIAIEYCQTNAATDPSPSGSPLPSP